MKKYLKQLSYLLLSHIYFVIPHAWAELDSGDIQDEAVIKQAKAVVLGRITNRIGQENWVYSDQYDNNGNAIDYSELINVYEFEVTEVLDGSLDLPVISLYMPINKNTDISDLTSNNQLLSGEQMVIGVSLDSGAERKGEVGFNVVHGRSYPAQDSSKLNEIRTWVAETRSIPAPSLDDELEAAYEGTGTGDDINLESPTDEEEYTDEDFMEPAADDVVSRQKRSINEPREAALGIEPPGEVENEEILASLDTQRNRVVGVESSIDKQETPSGSPDNNVDAVASPFLRWPLLLLILILAGIGFFRLGRSTRDIRK